MVTKVHKYRDIYREKDAEVTYDADLNENETKVFEAVKIASEKNGDAFIDLDLLPDTGFSKHEIAGYLSSLTVKGYISPWDDCETNGTIIRGLMTWDEGMREILGLIY